MYFISVEQYLELRGLRSVSPFARISMPTACRLQDFGAGPGPQCQCRRCSCHQELDSSASFDLLLLQARPELGSRLFATPPHIDPTSQQHSKNLSNVSSHDIFPTGNLASIEIHLLVVNMVVGRHHGSRLSRNARTQYTIEHLVRSRHFAGQICAAHDLSFGKDSEF